MKRSLSRGGEVGFFSSSRLVGFRRNGSARRGATALKIASLIVLFASALPAAASASTGTLPSTLTTVASSTGTSASDTATLTVSNSGPLPTGTISFTLYNAWTNAQVGTPETGDALGTGSSGVYTVTTSPSDFTSLSPGSYYFEATYSGDGSYASVNDTNDRAAETFTIGAGSAGSVNLFNQCANGTNGTGGTSGTCNWINGDLNGQNSSYPEGTATVQFVDLTNLTPNTVNTVTLAYQTTKSGKHAYDFLTTWNFSEPWIVPSDACQGVIGCSTGTGSGSTFNSPSTLAIPTDPNASGFDTGVGARNFTMMGGTLDAATTPTVTTGSYSAGVYSSDSITSTTVTFTTPSSGAMCSSGSCEVVLLFGAHVASETNWGTGTGAGSISGSPYHVFLTGLNGTSIGNRDNQMQASAVIAEPTVTTSLSSTSVSVGGSVSDSATVTDVPGANNGSVAFTVFSDSGCTTPATGFTSVSVPLITAGGTVGPVSLGTFASAGTYYVQATYTGGNGSNLITASSLCGSEVVTVQVVTPTVVTTANAGATSATDTVTVSGPPGDPTPTGSVVFTLYSSNGTSEGTNSQTLSGGKATSTAFPLTGLSAGTYHFVAVYTPDNGSGGSAYYGSGNDGGTATTYSTGESFSIGALTPTLTTSASSSGTSASDTATFTVPATGPTPTGTITFTVYNASTNAQVGSAESGVALGTGSSGVYTISTSPSDFTNLNPGSYYFVATYVPGSNHNYVTVNDTGDRTAESFSIAILTPTVVTTANAGSNSATDTVTVSGPAGEPTPTGSVLFTLYSSSGVSVGTNTQPLSGGTATSAGFSLTGLSAGSYHFVAVYTPDNGSGGSAYYGSGNDGGSATVSSVGESFSVTSPPPPPPPGTPPTAALSTTPSVNGLAASDLATVTGNSGTPTGTVTFTLYSGQSGSGTLVAGYAPDQVTLVNGSATSAPSGTLPAGNYYFMVSYSGDSVYSKITPGTAEAFSIAFLTPVLGTTPTVTGLSATDSATVTGTSGTPTGTVTFTLFAGTPGSGKQVGSYTPDTVTLVSGTASSAPTPTLPSGNYYFMVTYSGDGTYSAITPGTAEAFTIIAVSPAPAPKKHKKPVVPPYKIPTKPPTTGFGGSARTVYNGGLLVGGSSVLLLGLLMMAYALRRRRRS